MNTSQLPTWRYLAKMARSKPWLYVAHALLWTILATMPLIPGLIATRLLRHTHGKRAPADRHERVDPPLRAGLAAARRDLAAGRLRRDRHALHDEWPATAELAPSHPEPAGRRRAPLLDRRGHQPLPGRRARGRRQPRLVQRRPRNRPLRHRSPPHHAVHQREGDSDHLLAGTGSGHHRATCQRHVGALSGSQQSGWQSGDRCHRRHLHVGRDAAGGWGRGADRSLLPQTQRAPPSARSSPIA